MDCESLWQWCAYSWLVQYCPYIQHKWSSKRTSPLKEKKWYYFVEIMSTKSSALSSGDVFYISKKCSQEIADESENFKL